VNSLPSTYRNTKVLSRHSACGGLCARSPITVRVPLPSRTSPYTNLPLKQRFDTNPNLPRSLAPMQSSSCPTPRNLLQLPEDQAAMPTSTAWVTVYLPAATITLTPLPAAAGIPPHWAATPAFPPGLIIFALFFLALLGITIIGYTLQNRPTQPSPPPAYPLSPPQTRPPAAAAADPRSSIPLSPWHQPPSRQPSERVRMRLAREPQSVLISLPGARGLDYRRRSEWGSIHDHGDGYRDRLDDSDDVPGRPSGPTAQHAPGSSVYTDYDRSRRPSSAPSMPSPVRGDFPHVGEAARPATEARRAAAAGGGGEPRAYRGSVAPTSTVLSTHNLGFGSMPRDRSSRISMPSAPAESEFDTVFTGDPY
ncbi:uncharacterized protein BDZ99DRAFT_530272, partial [Mytilinidion resinicola]